MDFELRVWIPPEGINPKEYPSILLTDKAAVRYLFLYILADDRNYHNWYQWMCSAENSKEPFPQNLLGSAIYQKSGGKLSTVQEVGAMEGFFKELFPE